MTLNTVHFNETGISKQGVDTTSVDSRLFRKSGKLRTSKYPFRQMAIGDSFDVAVDVFNYSRERGIVAANAQRQGVPIAIKRTATGFTVVRKA